MREYLIAHTHSPGVQDIVVDYSVKMIYAALDSAVARERSTRGKNLPSIQAEDVLALVDQDPIKFGRVKELLVMQQEIETAKKSFTNDVESLAQEQLKAAGNP